MSKFLPVIAAAITGILVGSALVATRFVIGQTDPISLALWRYLIGFGCLLPPLLLSGWIRFERRDLLPISLLGIIQFGVLISLLNYSVQFIPSARAALIFATLPLLTMLLAAVFRYEGLSWAKSTGVLLTVVGVGLALGEKGLQSGGVANRWLGEGAAFASAFSGALCSVLYRPYLRKYPTLPVSALAMLASVGFLALLAAREGFFNSLPHFSAGGWLAVGFIGLSSGVGYYLWLWALNNTTPTKVAVFLSLSPFTATALGVLFLDEQISTPFLLGLTCVGFGLWLSHRPAHKYMSSSFSDI